MVPTATTNSGAIATLVYPTASDRSASSSRSVSRSTGVDGLPPVVRATGDTGAGGQAPGARAQHRRRPGAPSREACRPGHAGRPNAPLPGLPANKQHKKAKNQANFNARAHYARIVGVDLVAVLGLSAGNVQAVITDVGTDMSRFSTSKHCCAWLGLAPRNAISGGKVLHSHTSKVANWATQAFRLAAYAVSRSETAVGACYHSMHACKGPQQAIEATAHKLARIVYHLLKTGEAYVEQSAGEYEEQRREHELRQLARRASKFGLTLASAPTPRHRPAT